MAGLVIYFVICAIVLIPLAALARTMLKGRRPEWISYYNMLPESEKKKYDPQAMSRFMGKCLFVILGILVVVFIGAAFGNVAWILGGIAAIIIVAVGSAIYFFTGKRFLKK